MTIAQRFSAGSKMMGSTQAREAGGRISAGDHQASDLCRPFHGLATLVTFPDPSAEALGYFPIVRFRGRRTTSTFGQGPRDRRTEVRPWIRLRCELWLSTSARLVSGPFNHAADRPNRTAHTFHPSQCTARLD